MSTLKGLLVVGGFFAVLLAVLVPATWLYTASTLPNPVESELDLETHLRQSIESERRSVELTRRERERQSVTWERPDFSRLPKHLLALYITETGCPTYFQTPREDGLAWTRRVLWSLLDKSPDGDGACELIFAHRLARRLGAKTSMQVAVLSDRIHHFLQKDQLVAFDLHSMELERGVIGVEAASRALLQKNLNDLSLAEVAELQLGLPPDAYWDEVWRCENGALIKQSRDALLDRLAMVGLVSEETARTAAAQPPRCLSVKR